MDTNITATFCGHRLTEEQAKDLLSKYDQLDDRMIAENGGYIGCRIVEVVCVGDCVLFGALVDDEEVYFLGLLFEVTGSRWHMGDTGHWIADTWPDLAVLLHTLRELGIEPEESYVPRRAELWGVLELQLGQLVKITVRPASQDRGGRP